MRPAILVDRQTVDVLHHEIRQALAAGAAVEQPRDVRMLEPGEDLALVSKALQHGVAIHAALDEFDGGAHRELRIVALAKKDGAHAAATQLAHDAIRADVTGFRENRRGDALDSRRRIADKRAGLRRRRAGAVRLPRAARHRRRTQPQARRARRSGGSSSMAWKSSSSCCQRAGAIGVILRYGGRVSDPDSTGVHAAAIVFTVATLRSYIGR